jgi:tetratricopeptide (TPR) repeat protein
VVADTDRVTADSLLEELETASMLLATDSGRYRFHSLVRLHARERAAAQEPDTEHKLFSERVMQHFLARSAFADRAVQADRLRIAVLDSLLREHSDPFGAGGGREALAWLEVERHNILALVEIAGSWDLDVMGWQLAESFTVLFLHHRHLREWLASLEGGVACAVRARNSAAEARLRSLSSRPLMDLGEDERAHEQLEQAVVCAATSGNTALRASVLEFFGRYWDRFDSEHAVAVYQEAIQLNRQAEEWRGVAIATHFLGCAQDAVGRHAEALETLRGARQKLLERGDQRMAARALAAVGRVHDHLGDSAAAAALSEAAHVLQQDVDATAYEAQARVDLAHVIRRAGGSPQTEREHLSRAWKIYADGGSRDAEALGQRLDELGGPLEA